MKQPALIRTAFDLAQLPGIQIQMSGGEGCRVLFSSFTRRHERLKVIQRKRWGVALLEIPETFEDYLGGPDRAHLRREFNRARRAGMSFAALDPSSRIGEIMAINSSAETRQGQPMHMSYLDEAEVRRYFEQSADVFGVTDTNGVLKAYICVRTCGEVACVERILGHADALGMGVMWVLVAGAIRDLVERRRVHGRPIWFMYDTYFGASPGLRQFKQWAGFEPYRVSWSWRS